MQQSVSHQPRLGLRAHRPRASNGQHALNANQHTWLRVVCLYGGTGACACGVGTCSLGCGVWCRQSGGLGVCLQQAAAAAQASHVLLQLLVAAVLDPCACCPSGTCGCSC